MVCRQLPEHMVLVQQTIKRIDQLTDIELDIDKHIN